MHEDYTAVSQSASASRQTSRNRQSLIVGVATLVVSTIIFIIIAETALKNHYGGNQAQNQMCQSTLSSAITGPYNEQQQTSHRQTFMDSVSPDTIKAHVREYGRLPHLTGLPRNNALNKMTADSYRSFGFDKVHEMTFPILLDNVTKRSVNVTSADGTSVTYECVLDELNIINQEGWNERLRTSNGYSGDGRVQGQVVWANWGRLEDFQKLDSLGIDLTNKIVVTRYGRIFRGNKVQLAALRGAAGVLIVQDPGIVGPGMDPANPRPVFPEGPWANNRTVQRGSVSLAEGDPRTPDWPSQPGGPFLSNDEAMGRFEREGQVSPNIPVMPLGYGDAYKVLNNLGGGNTLPDDWKDTGFLDQLSAGGIGPSTNLQVQLEVRRTLEVFNVTHVSAEITGSVEPDRVVLLGSHQDAWVYGSIDPIAGHSIVMEIARRLGELKTNQGWRPRRSIQVNSWDCEEWNIASSEYVQTQLELMRQRAVAYLNVDTAVTGNETLEVEITPLLRDVFDAAAAEVNVPQQSSSSSSSGTKIVPVTSLPSSYSTPASGSDFVGFVQFAGVPSLSAEFSSKDGRYQAVYHSAYGSAYWTEKFADPGYIFHAALARVLGNVALRLAESAILPMNTQTYSNAVQGFVNDYIQDSTPSSPPPKYPLNDNVSLDWSFMNHCVNNFIAASTSHMSKVNALATQIASNPLSVNPFVLRGINDQLMGVERVFIATSANATAASWYRHVIFTPSSVNAYGSSVMPVIQVGLLTKDPVQASFAVGRVGQFICQAAEFLNQTGVLPPVY